MFLALHLSNFKCLAYAFLTGKRGVSKRSENDNNNVAEYKVSLNQNSDPRANLSLPSIPVLYSLVQIISPIQSFSVGRHVKCIMCVREMW